MELQNSICSHLVCNQLVVSFDWQCQMQRIGQGLRVVVVWPSSCGLAAWSGRLVSKCGQIIPHFCTEFNQLPPNAF